MYIDTHAHLNFKSYKKDIDSVIKRAAKANVEKIVVPGTKLSSSREAVKIAQDHSQCFAAVGIHPHHATDSEILLDNSSQVGNLKRELASLSKHTKVVAIGEIGLDYHHYRNYPPISDADIQAQTKLFNLQLELAAEINLPIILHCRQSYDDLIATLASFLTSPKKIINGVFHCFEGKRRHLFTLLSLGFYVGYNGNITYPENQRLRNLVKSTPIDRILLETDSPFLTPVPFRGKCNEPSYLPRIAATVADIHKMGLKSIEEITTNNALKLFNL